jgi:dUTP pyrophosphatase
VKLKIKRLHPDAVVPAYMFIGDAGADLVVVEGGTLLPGEAKDFPVGWAVEAPLGYWFLIHGRSSTLRKRGLYVNPGIIDNGYRGPLYVYARNDNGHPVTVEPGDRLAQMILLPYTQPVIEVVEELSDSDRGTGGFGSTGLKA